MSIVETHHSPPSPLTPSPPAAPTEPASTQSSLTAPAGWIQDHRNGESSSEIIGVVDGTISAIAAIIGLVFAFKRKASKELEGNEARR